MVDKNRLLEAHQLRWLNTWIWLGIAAIYFSLQGLLAVNLAQGGPWWLSGLVILVMAHLMHDHLLAFHEAAHGMLSPYRPINDAVGLFVGTNAFLPFNLYKAVHHLHHSHLATERDEEQWPFIDPNTSLWRRRLAALLELTMGLFFTPVLFLRSFLRKGSPIQSPTVRRAIWMELALQMTFWGSVVAVTAYFGLWTFLLVLFVLPAWLAGNLQSWRKYIEHMGMTGSTVVGATRSIVPTTWLGRWFAFSVFNIPYHGVHHTYARMSQEYLPEFVSILEPAQPNEPAPYRSYWTAMWDMLATLKDPRVGPQWESEGAPARMRIGKARELRKTA